MRYEDSGSICSFSEYIDDLEKEITEKDAEIERLRSIKSSQSDIIDMKSKQLQDAKDLVRELVKVGEFYGNADNYSLTTHTRPRIKLAQRIIAVDDCEQIDGYILPVAGKLSRTTLKQSADKIKSLLGEEYGL